MPMYKVSVFHTETEFILKADSEEHIGEVLDTANFGVDSETVFAETATYRGPVIDKIIKIGD